MKYFSNISIAHIYKISAFYSSLVHKSDSKEFQLVFFRRIYPLFLHFLKSLQIPKETSFYHFFLFSEAINIQRMLVLKVWFWTHL